MRNGAPPANVAAFHLGVQPNGEEITMSRFNSTGGCSGAAIEDPFRLFGVS